MTDRKVKVGMRPLFEAVLDAREAYDRHLAERRKFTPEERVAMSTLLVDALIKGVDLETAQRVNDAMVQHTMYKMGLREEPPPDMSDVDLLDMVLASMVVRALERREKPGSPRTIRTVMDDRAVAAIYTAYHYDADLPRDTEPIVLLPGKACVVVRVRTEEEA